MSESRSINRAGSVTAAVRWRGWRLPFVDYEPWQHGHDLVFVLENEGDLMLIPLALQGRCAAPSQAIDGDEVETVLAAVHDWLAQGWRIVGRVYTSFVGYDAEDDFWRETYLSLGRLPRKKAGEP